MELSNAWHLLTYLEFGSSCTLVWWCHYFWVESVRNKVCMLAGIFLIHMKVLIIFDRDLIVLLARIISWLLNLRSIIHTMNVWWLFSIHYLLCDVIVPSDYSSLRPVNLLGLLGVFEGGAVVFHASIVQGPRHYFISAYSEPLSIVWNHVKFSHLSWRRL